MTEINEESLSIIPLHHHPEYMKQCCDLINEEWPRSETARMLGLQTSCDKLPTCLIMLNLDKKIIGHCKLTPIPSIPTSCFVESVVIGKSLRGKGLGTFLMRASEEYCRTALSLSTIHLSTKGQEKFYKKLGYEICEPVSIYGSFTVTNTSVKPIQNIERKQPTKILSPCPPPLPPTIEIKHSKPGKIYMVKSLK